MVLVFFAVDQKNQAQAAPNSTVYINPASSSPSLNSSLDVNAVINPGNNEVSAVELHISFNKSILRLNSITPNTSAFSDILIAAQIDNNAGTGSIVIATGVTAGYVTSIQNIATLNFTAIGLGSSNISLDGTMAAARNEGGDVITTRTPGTVTVSRTFGNADFSNLVSQWLQTGTGLSADVNGDQVVNTRDAGIMMSNWGG